MSTITTIQGSDQVKDSRSTINTNFSNLNTDKLESGNNVGTGDGQLVRGKTTTGLDIKTIKAGTNIAATNNANDVTIDVTATVSDASTTVKGITKVSVAPASAANPIAVGDNDPRVPTQSENDALASTTSPGSSNKFVSQADFQKAAEVYATDSGSANTYAVTLSPVPSAYSAGMIVRFKATNANTSASTLNVNSLGAKTIKKLDGATDLSANDIRSGQLVVVVYDGTNFQMVSPISLNVQIPKVKTYTAFETAARFALSNGGGGSSPTFNTDGINLVSGGSAGYSKALFNVGSSTSIALFNAGGIFSAAFRIPTIGTTGSLFLGLGSPTAATTGHTFTDNHIGFKVVISGSVATLYATVANGTTETASGSLTTIASTDQIEILAVINSSSSVDFYYRKNGGALSAATNISTNIPSAATNTAQLSISNDNTASSSQLTADSMGFQR